MNLNDLKKQIKINKINIDEDVLEYAYEYAKEAHKGQKRLTKEDYIEHPIRVAQQLIKLGLDQDTIIAGLLHDVPEDTDRTINDIKKEFGEKISFLVNGITKLSKVKYRGMDMFVESLRKMFVAMAEDIRVVFIKFADRLDNLETLYALPPEKQKRIAKETLEIYAPIAARLGIGTLKGSLEDKSFPYVYPDEYKWLMETIKDKREEQKKIVEEYIVKINQLLKENHIKNYEIDGRVKHNYSLYKKLMRPKYNKDINKIYDLVALRIIVNSIEECYLTLGIIHNQWKPMPERFKDYIAQPKPNGYQSLHTVIFTQNKHPIEFQIRTKKMHEIAEYGIAAHFHYKDSNKKNAPKISGDQLAWLKQLKKIQKEIKENDTLLETIKLDIFQNRIFVFTPKGDVMDLPEKATAIDFAYHIHTYLGDHFGGAIVNGKKISEDEPLKSGDVVEIITNKNRKGPDEKWLDIVKTHTAKYKIKSSLNRHKKNTISRLISQEGD